MGVAQSPESTEQLESLGYEQQLRREFGFWHASAVGFADISPIVAMYGMFGLALAAAGPTMFWGLFVVLGFQMLVALVFAEVSSRYPLTGGVYQWTRQLTGIRPAWFAGWAYTATMVFGCAALSYFAALYLILVVGWESAGNTETILVALGCLAFATFANMIGQWVLKLFVTIAVVCEFVGSIGLGVVLLVGYRVNPISVLWDSFGTKSGSTWDWFTFAWLGAVAFIGWSFIGFEATGTLGEEVREPRKVLPKAILLVLGGVGLVVIFTSLAWILAIPDLSAAMSGDVADPVLQTLGYHMGDTAARVFMGIIVLSFIACVVAVQTAVSRTVFSFARDRAIPGHRFLSAVSKRSTLPIRAIAVCGSLSGILLLVNLGAERVFQTLMLFVSAGFYISFAFPVAAALYVHLKHQYKPGPFSLGRLSYPVTLVALLWLLFEIVNIAWPRYPELDWYSNWGVVIMIGVVGVLGLVAYMFAPSHELAREELERQRLQDVTDESTP